MRFNLLKRNILHGMNTVKTVCATFYGKCKQGLLTLSVSMTTALLMNVTAFAADGDTTGKPGAGSTIWQWLDYSLNDLYTKFLGVSTIAACVAASVCLIMMNFSTDDRAVSTSRAWLKRILISWVILNVLSYVMTYMVDLTSGGKYISTGGAGTSTP